MTRAAGAPGTAGGGYRGGNEGRCSGVQCWYTLPVVDGLVVAHSKAGTLDDCEGADRPPLTPAEGNERRLAWFTDNELAAELRRRAGAAAEPTDGLREALIGAAAGLPAAEWDGHREATRLRAVHGPAVDRMLAGPLADLLAKLQAVDGHVWVRLPAEDVAFLRGFDPDRDRTASRADMVRVVEHLQAALGGER